MSADHDATVDVMVERAEQRVDVEAVSARPRSDRRQHGGGAADGERRQRPLVRHHGAWWAMSAMGTGSRCRDCTSVSVCPQDVPPGRTKTELQSLRVHTIHLVHALG